MPRPSFWTLEEIEEFTYDTRKELQAPDVVTTSNEQVFRVAVVQLLGQILLNLRNSG